MIMQKSHIICEYILEKTSMFFASRETFEAFHVCQASPSNLFK